MRMDIVDRGLSMGRPFVLPSYQRANADPGIDSLIGAAWRQENLIGSTLALPFITSQIDPEFDPMEFIPEELQQPEYASWYSRANTPEDVHAMTKFIRQRLQDRETLARGGFTGWLSTMFVGGAIDPLNWLIPNVGYLKGAGYLRNAARYAGGAAGAIAATEAGLLATQPTRTIQESAINVGGGALIMGLLGPPAGKFFSNLKDKKAAEKALEERVTGQTDWIAGEEPGQAWRAYRKGENYPLALPKVIEGEMAESVADRAFAQGILGQEDYKLLKYLLTKVDPNFDQNTRLTISDEVRRATRFIMKEEGYGDDVEGTITGETVNFHQADGLMRAAIRLYRGHAGDTILEEWYHRWWDLFLGDEDRAVYQRYHDASGDLRSVQEHFGQEGRDYFFSRRLHERAGTTLTRLFEKAKKVFFRLVGRIRGIQEAQIPPEIEDMYRIAVHEYGEEFEFTRPPQKFTSLVEVEKRQIQKQRDSLLQQPSREIKAMAKEMGIPVGKRGKKPLIEEILKRRAADAEAAPRMSRREELLQRREGVVNQAKKWERLYPTTEFTRDTLPEDVRDWFDRAQQEVDAIDAELEGRRSVSYQVREDVQKGYFDVINRQTEIVEQMDELENKYSDLDELPPIYYKELKPLEKEFEKLEETRSDLYEELLSDIPNKIIFENEKGEVTQYFSKNILGNDIFHMRFWDQPEGEWREGAREGLIERLEQEAGRIPFSKFQLARKREGRSYQVREAEVADELLQKLQPLPEGDRVAPIRGLSQEASDAALKYIEAMHPGARPYFAKYSRVPAAITEQLANGWEFLTKNLRGERTAENAEIMKRRLVTGEKQKAERSMTTGFVNFLKRQRGEATATEARFGEIVRAKMNWRTYQDFKRQVGIAINELAEGRGLESLAPEVREVATQIGKQMNDLGKRLRDAGLLAGPEVEKRLARDAHFSHIWVHGAVRKWRKTVKGILRENLPDEVPDEALEEALNSVTGSPTGSTLSIDLSGATDAQNLDLWKAKFLLHRELDIPYQQLIGVKVREGDAEKLIDFIQMDPLKMFDSYLGAVSGQVVLAEKFGDITMKPQIKKLWDDYQEAIKKLPDGVSSEAIDTERRHMINDIIALRDMVAGNYARAFGYDPGSAAYRVSKAALQFNAMKALGGMTLSAMADLARPLFHWGFEYYAPALANYVSVFRSPEFRAFSAEMRDVWGAALSAFNAERFNAYADLSDEFGGSRLERGIQYLSDHMGLLTGMDMWNATLKEISGYVASHAVLDIAEKLRAAGVKDFEAASRVVDPGFLRNIARMGLDTSDLVAIAEQVATHGEKYESLILPKTYRWTDKSLRSRFESAMVKEIDDIIITPGVGDRPLWMHWGIGAHAGQFKSFAMATMRAVLIQGAQSMDAKNIQCALASTAIGAGIYALKQLESGKEVSDNPAKILLEGIDRGGLTAYLMDIDSMASRLGMYSVQGMVGGEGVSRIASKGKWDILLGPTAGTLDQAVSFGTRTLPHAMTGDLVQNDIPPAFNLLPYGKVPYWRWILERARRAAQEGLPAVIQEEE